MFHRLVRWFSSKHVFEQNLIVYLTMSLIPTFVVTVLVCTTFYRNMRIRTKTDLSNTISLLSSNLEDVCSHVEDASNSLVNFDRVQEFLTRKVEGSKISRYDLFSIEQSIALFFDNSMMRSISLFDLDMHPVHFPTENETAGEFLSGHVNEAFHHKPVWLFDSAQNLIHVFRPVESTRNFTRLGYVDVTVYPAMLQQILNQADLGKGSNLMLLDSNMKRVVGSSFSLEGILDGNEGEKQLDVDGVPSYVFTQKLKGTNWLLVGCIPKKSAYAGIYRIMVLEVLMVVLVTAIVCFLSLQYARYTQRRVGRIAHAMERYTGGDSSVMVAVDENPEFGTLCLHFNQMVERINSLIDSEYKAQIMLDKAELKMLQAQINPHFLYNTLNIMYWKAWLAKQEDLAKMVLSLSNLLHTSIDRKVEFLTIKEEMRNLEDYLFIQRMHFQDKVEIMVCVPVDVEEYLVPKLVLQPIVENSFVHGLEPKKGKGTISVSCQEEGGDLLFKIRDDGVGMDEKSVENLLVEQPGKSFQGLVNVNRRLQLYYGPSYGITVVSRKGEGTTLRMRVKKEKSHVPGPVGG